jgi:hypothetical protein
MTEQKKERLSPKKVQDDLTEKLDKVVASTNDAIADLNEKIDSSMDAILKAVNNPVEIRKTFEPMEQNLGEDYVREASEVDGEAVIETPSNVNPNSAEFQHKTASLAFMEEPVQVHIHDTSEKNADPVFDISVNGKKKTFVRGQEYTVKRKFVEGLARAKPVSFGNEEYTKPSGERAVRWPSHRGLRYGFSVVRDDNPRGKAWLKDILAQS